MCALQKGRKVGSIDRGRYSLFFICSSVTCVEEKRREARDMWMALNQLVSELCRFGMKARRKRIPE